MIRHVVLFSFKDHLSDEVADEVLTGLNRFPEKFGAMQRFGLGRNLSRRDATFTHVMTMEFQTLQDLADYLDSEQHEHFVASVFKPNVSRRAIASYET